jgi:predicted metal-dependent phosphoesterase TrpH
MERLIKVDFHCHTIYSNDSLNFVPQLLRCARHRGLDRLVITDHNSLRGALLAKELDPDLVIIGEEIQTTAGEILAAFVQEEIPRGLDPHEAIDRLKSQGAFISLSHPFDSNNRSAWPENILKEIIHLVDAIEVFNARNIDKSANAKAAQYAKTHQLAGTAGSDAHIPFEIGCAAMVLPNFNTADELRKVIRKGRLEGKLSPFWVHFASALARLYKLFSHLPGDR